MKYRLQPLFLLCLFYDNCHLMQTASDYSQYPLTFGDINKPSIDTAILSIEVNPNTLDILAMGYQMSSSLPSVN